MQHSAKGRLDNGIIKPGPAAIHVHCQRCSIFTIFAIFNIESCIFTTSIIGSGGRSAL